MESFPHSLPLGLACDSRNPSVLSTAAFQSLCAVQQRRKALGLRTAASLLHAAAFGLRASLAGNQKARARRS